MMNTREILKILAKRSWKALALATAMIIVSLFAQDEIYLTGALLIGYLLGAFYFISTAGRLERAASMIYSQKRQMRIAKAKREMIFGMLLRITMIFVALMVAVKISTKIFAVAVMGFFVIFVLGLFFLSKISLESRIGRG